MGSVIIDGGLVHYEVMERDEPVICLHGWLGSWRYWVATMEALSARYRVYALDMWGFGDSDKLPERCNVPSFVDLVDKFMEEEGLSWATLIGHSTGGTGSLKLALDRPEKVRQLVLVGAVVQGSSVSPIIGIINNPLTASAFVVGRVLGHLVIKLVAMWLSSSWQVWYKEILDDALKVTRDSSYRSMQSLRGMDLSSRIGLLDIPVLAVYGEHDNIVDPRQGDLIQDRVHTATLVKMKKCKHFPMLDKPDEFNKLVVNFMERRRVF